MTQVYIHDIATFLPGDAIDNEHMESVLGQVGRRPSRARRAILRSNGIHRRYYAIDPDSGAASHTNAQLSAEAVRRLGNGFDADAIGCLACATTLADQLMPSHAVMVHGELGTPACEVVATAGVCTAGVSAIKYAWQSIACGDHDSAVATASENASAVMRGHLFEPELTARLASIDRHPEIAFEKDFLRWMLSDGAGAMWLRPTPRMDGPSLRLDWIHLRSYANEMSACMYAGAEKLPDGRLRGWKEFAPEQWPARSVFSIKQDVKQLNEHVIHYTVERPLQELQHLRGLSADQVDYFVPHYSSQYFRDRVADGMRRVGFAVPMERWFSNLAECGNTGSASIYIMLAQLWRGGDLRPGQRLLCYVPESGRFSSAFMQLTVCAPGQA